MPVTDDVEATLAAVPSRLRDLRHRRGFTLTEVAEETGIGVSTLSRLESGLRRASLDLLLPLARTYRVPLDDLVGAPPSGDPRIHPRPVRRDGMVYLPLSRRPGGVQAFKLLLPGRPAPAAGPAGDVVRREARTHEGYEWLYVLSGRLHLHLGSTVTELGPGEAAEFDTRTPHVLASAGPEPTEVLTLFSPEGERVHVRGG
ncbi:helix-turn-helix domain-containing protein [Nocardioides alkalitolerans]|uniref:helix-turn-helix domain-containing protein n=1 Tax=Nocardioides alkalitolerans TaxID=281714 RepID=UPI00048A59E0|nr:XRE family transcriptional regulator [Nocardioides alkalitolerans]